MIPNPSAVSVAREVLQTGSEFFLEVMEKGFTSPRGLSSLAPEMNAIFARSEAQTAEIFFQNLLKTAPDFISGGGSALEASSTEALAESLAVSAERSALTALAEGTGSTIAGNAGATLTRTLLEAGARGVVIGLLISVTQYALNRVKRWRTQIAISRAHTAVSATLTATLLEVFRDSDPKLQPWPAPWAKPETETHPVTEDEQRRKQNSGKRYRRMQRTRRK